MDVKKLVLSGIAGGVVFYILSTIGVAIIQAFAPFNYLDLPGMRQITDPVLLLFFLYPFVLSFAMAIAYQKFEPSLSGNFFDKGKKFGLMMWLVSSLPSAFIVYTSMNYPVGFTVENFFASFFYMIAVGITIAKLSE
ncbi:MAG: hypothetical protein HY392_00620 [Candidatus Diapherotrites archaeon]|nr:hypothetical protein [Candidatus Diapherotrites archaeon]